MSNGEHQDRIFLALMGASTAAAAAVVGILGLGWEAEAGFWSVRNRASTPH